MTDPNQTPDSPAAPASFISTPGAPDTYPPDPPRPTAVAPGREPGLPNAQGFVSNDHVLYAGWVIAMALRNGVKLEPVYDNEGNYTSQVFIRLRNKVKLTFLIPPPPPDWIPFAKA